MQRMVKQQRRDDGLARFGEPGVLVLLSLSDGPKHGYAITADVLARTGIDLGPGTLYGSLTKLVDRGLIVALPSEDRRRPYEITEPGRVALAAQLETWSRVVEAGRAQPSPASPGVGAEPAPSPGADRAEPARPPGAGRAKPAIA